MKIIGVETLQMKEAGNLVWVQLHTDEGLIGLGETFRNPEAVIAYVHETCAPALVGKDPARRTALSHDLARRVGNHFNGFPSRSVEVSGNSAVDLALWDLFGKIHQAPLYRLLGGAVHESVRIYNTCAGSRYNNRVRHGYNTELISRDDPAPEKIDPLDDLLLQVFEPAHFGRRTPRGRHHGDEDGRSIGLLFVTTARRSQSLNCKRRSGRSKRSAVLPATVWVYHDRIPRPVVPSDCPPHCRSSQGSSDLLARRANLDAELRRPCAVPGQGDRPGCGSENLGTLPWYREVFCAVRWTSRISTLRGSVGLAKRNELRTLLEAYDRTIAPHDCTGPVTLGANVHLLVASPNALICETVRAHVRGFYAEIVDEVPTVENGRIRPSESPGVGMRLSDSFLARSDLSRRLTGKAAQ